MGKYILGIAMVLLTIFALVNPFDVMENFQKKNSPPVEEVVFQRPTLAPNGFPWPLATGYIDGYKRLNRIGRSTIQVENYQSGHDFYVKLVHSAQKKHSSVRHAFVKRFESFKFAKVTPGTYYLMYRNLGTGESTKSEEFKIEERRVYGGVKYNDMRITMYHVNNGNASGETISDAEFAMADIVNKKRMPSEN